MRFATAGWVGAAALIAGVAAHRWTLMRVEGELARAREQVRALQDRQISRVELTAARKRADDAVARAEALEHELADTRARLQGAQAAMTAAEKRLAVLSPPTGEPVPATRLLKGSYAEQDDLRIYSPDAQLRVGRDIVISSPVGIMLSDAELATVAGDLAVETPSGRFEAEHAFVDLANGKMEMTADSMTFSSQPAPAPAAAATPPAGH